MLHARASTSAARDPNSDATKKQASRMSEGRVRDGLPAGPDPEPPAERQVSGEQGLSYRG